MQESMVKFLLILVALLSLMLGAGLLIIPGWFVAVSQADATNVAWLRALGASVVSVQGIGLAVVVFRRRDTNPLLGVIALATTVEMGIVWYALIAGEFGEAALWAVIVPGIVATAASVVLWGAWFSRHKSIRLFGSGLPDASNPPGEGPPPPEAGMA